jgi:hypothetical protein
VPWLVKQYGDAKLTGAGHGRYADRRYPQARRATSMNKFLIIITIVLLILNLVLSVFLLNEQVDTNSTISKHFAAIEQTLRDRCAPAPPTP